MLDNSSIRAKNYLLIGLTIFTCILTVGVTLNMLQDTLKSERRVLINDMTEMAHSIIKRKYQFFQQGKLNEEQAKKEALESLRSIRYGEDGYFFVYENGKVKLLPYMPEKEGQDLMNITDPNGVRIVEELTELTKGGKKGFLEYLWTIPHTGEVGNKVSVAIGFEPWNWLVGTGAYQDNMNSVLSGLAKSRASLIALTFIVFIMLVFLIYMINRSSARRAVLVKSHLERFSKGDFTARIDASGDDEFGQMLVSLGHVKGQMNKTLWRLKTTASSVREGMSEIAKANQHLAQRTEQQATSLADSNTALSSISSSVRHNSNSVQQAHDFAHDAQNTVERGGEVVKQAIGAMDAINTSSSRVTEIVDVIDGIAFQTNLLALNAAVEAARAGEQGKGFAVVANEVRNLAQRSATSAQEIKKLIEESGRNVKTGSELVSRSGELLEEILNSSQKVSGTLQDIASATEQQAAGVENTSQTISTLDGFVQQNAAMVEEVAVSSKGLLNEADDMIKVVDFFRIEESDQSHQQPRRGPSAWESEAASQQQDDDWDAGYSTSRI